MKKVSLFFWLNFFVFFSASAQYTITGKVVSNEDDQPIQGVTVTVGMNLLQTLTDSNGIFSFTFRSQDFLLRFSHVGFETKEIDFQEKYNPGTFVLNRSNAFLAEAIVKAYESNTNISNIPVAIGLLQKRDLERYSNSSFVPAMNTIPGVKMDERSPGSYRLAIRGNLLRSPFGVRNVKVYWNGIPFTDANGNTYINELGFSNIGKIEIIKGPAGSMYGAGTSGVMLLTSGIAAKDENSITVNTVAGSYGLFTTGITYQNATGNSNNVFTYSHQQSDGYRQQANMRRDVASYAGTFGISDHRSVSANVFYSDLYYQTPGGLTLAQMEIDPKQARPAGGAFASATIQHAALYLQTIYTGLAQEYQFNNKWSNTTTMYTAHTRFRNPTIRNYERKTEAGVGARTLLQYKASFLKVHFGGEYQYGFTNTSVFGNKSGSIDTLQYHDEIDANSYNIFAQADLNLFDEFILNTGLSYNNYRYGYIRLNKLPANKEGRDFKPELIPRVSILYKIAGRYSLYASISKGFSPPSIDEIHPSDGNFNRELNAENAVNYEIGTRSELVKNKLTIEASFYIFGLTNTIVTRRDDSGADYFVNAGKTKQYGLEIAVNYYPLKEAKHFFSTIKLWSNYSGIDAKFKNYKQGTTDYSGNKLTGTAPNVITAGIDVITKPGLYADLTYNYTDIIPLNDGNTFFATQYNLLSGKFGYRVNLSRVIHSEIYFAFDNSFNKPYSLGNDLNAAGNRYFNPSAPQNFYGGLKLKFNMGAKAL